MALPASWSTMTLEECAVDHEACRAAGESHIHGSWLWLQPSTVRALVDSGFYSSTGRRQSDVSSGGAPFKDGERLEYALGVLKRSASAKLPLRNQPGQAIPDAALSEEVLTQALALVAVPQWRDPVFLRLALVAVAKHQQAVALSQVGAEVGEGKGWLGAAVRVVMLLAMPPALAVGISSAVSHQLIQAAVSFYVLAVGLLAARGTAREPTPPARGEYWDLAYEQWVQFELDGGPGQTGLGALERLRAAQALGVKIPIVAFDLADCLRHRSGQHD